MNRSIVSVLHHSIPAHRPELIAEQENAGWHFRTAKALRTYGGFSTSCIRPSGTRRWILRSVDNVPVILTPTWRLSPSDRLWKWSELSVEMADYVARLVSRYGFIPYVHEYRTLNSELVMRKLIEFPMILQHHGSYPPTVIHRSRAEKLDLIRHTVKIGRENLLRNVRGAIFVLNEGEKEYLESLGVEASVKIRTMAVDFDELKPVTEEEKEELRKVLGISEDSMVLCSYVGIFREGFSMVKGAHLIAEIWRELSLKTKKPLTMIVTGLSTQYVAKLESLGVKVYCFLPHEQYLNLVKASDVYFLPAMSSYYCGGPGVAVMEALALGKPVVSPTLIHFPQKEEVTQAGAITPFVDNECALRIFIECLAYVIENIDSFKAEYIRQISCKYYSWKSFVHELKQTVDKIS